MKQLMNQVPASTLVRIIFVLTGIVVMKALSVYYGFDLASLLS